MLLSRQCRPSPIPRLLGAARHHQRNPPMLQLVLTPSACPAWLWLCSGGDGRSLWAHHSLSPPRAVGGLGIPPLPWPLLPKSRKTKSVALQGLCAHRALCFTAFPAALPLCSPSQQDTGDPGMSMPSHLAPGHSPWAGLQRTGRAGLCSEPRHTLSSWGACSTPRPGGEHRAVEQGLGGFASLCTICFPVTPQQSRAAATDGSAAPLSPCGDKGWTHRGKCCV